MSTKPKVYLAKSNRANPELVSRVRQTLSKYDVEIVEFKGGQFSHKPMLECERLVVVPDLSDEEIVIGKGLYEQIIRFGRDKGYEYVFVIVEENLTYKELEQIEIIDSDDYIAYAVIEFSRGKGEKLITCFEDIYGVTTKGSLYPYTKLGSNYYHLIGRKK